jgi:GDP-L-fucose synthase
MEQGAKIYVAGHRGLVGSAILRKLETEGFANLVTCTSSELDLRSQAAVEKFFELEKPQYVFLAAAKVGGILANDSYPADFIRDNLQIQTNVIDAAHRHGVDKLLFLGSSCIYPRECPQPIREEYLLSGPLEETNQWYAVAKIAGIKQCQAYRRQYGFNAVCAMPTNLYGPGDNFDPKTSHALPALLRRFHEAAENGDETITVWGSGKPRREFLHVDDLADACLFLMRHYNEEDIINVGTGRDCTIAELAEMIRDITGCKGKIVYDDSKPDGTPRKLLDTSKLEGIGWTAKIPLREGIRQTYEWYRQQLQAQEG